MEDFKQFEGLGKDVKKVFEDAEKKQRNLKDQLDQYLESLTSEQRKAQMSELLTAQDFMNQQQKNLKDIQNGLTKGS